MQRYLKNQSEVISSSYFQNRGGVLRRSFTKVMESRQDNFTLKKGKRYRSAFTTEQVNYLENEFKKFPYIDNAHRKEVASILNIPERAVKIWFQNRRMKEKKEYDDQNNHRNVTFTNEQLNNVLDVPSTNDNRSNALLLLTTEEGTSNLNYSKTETYRTEGTTEIANASFYRQLSPTPDQSSKFNTDHKDKPVMMNSTSPSYKSSAEFSIDLCKKYRSDLIYSSQQPKNVKHEISPTSLIKQDKCDHNECLTQTVPEDLSCNKDKCKPDPDSIPKTVTPNNVGFQPVLVANYAQPYLPAGNMLWKPLNVMPIMSPGPSAVAIPSNVSASSSVSQDQQPVPTVPKKNCNCDCHSNVPNAVNAPEASQPPAQYILTAVPFQNYTKR